MKNIHIYIPLLLLIALVFTACEKVITPDLNDIDRVLVFETPLREGSEQSFKLTQSGDFYANSIDPISDAQVEVSEIGGATTPFSFDASTGRYVASGFQPLPGSTYTLSATHEGVTYESQAIMPTEVPIDTALVVQNIGGFFEGSFAYFTFSDQAETLNYYRAKLWVNDPENEEAGSYNLFDDDTGFVQDGEENEFVLFISDSLSSGDQVFIALESLDGGSYKYLETLSASLGNNSSSAAPFNPKGNITENALGYFGCVSTDTVMVLIP